MPGIKITDLPSYTAPFNVDSVIPISTGTGTYKLSAGSLIIPPLIVGGTVTSLAPGVTPTATITPDEGILGKFTINLGIPSGAAGTNGTNGSNGVNGVTPVFTADAITTTSPTPSASVGGTSANPVLHLVIPRGAAGADGANGAVPALTASVVMLETTARPVVTTTGTLLEPIFNFRLPKGEQGTPGIGINFKGRRASKAALTSVTDMSAGDAWFVDRDETTVPAGSSVFYVYGKDINNTSTWLSGGALQGPAGPAGTTTLITEVTAISAQAGTPVSVTNIGTDTAARFKFTIPNGEKGDTGAKGDNGNWFTPQVIKTVNGTGYMPTSADAGALILINTTSSFTLSAPTYSLGKFLSGQKVDFVRLNTGSVICAATNGATIYGTPGLTLRDRYSVGSIVYYDVNSWLAVGDLAV